VFPDHATLPALAVGGANVGGSSGGAPSEVGGGAGGIVEGSGAGAAEGGASPTPLGAGGESGAGAVVVIVGGAGGVGGDCENPRDVRLLIDLDTWLDSAQPKSSFASAPTLSVLGAPNERRAVLQLNLPASPDAVLRRATLSLELVSNADASLSVRHLSLHRLTREVSESASWRNYSSKKWNNDGGDFGPEVAQSTLAPGTEQGSLTFDVADLVRDASLSAPSVLSMVILENDPAPAAPAELAFASREGDASKAASLLLTYCEP
jgi:hypothetical protein